MYANSVLLDSDFCNMLTDIDGGKINSRDLLQKVINIIGKTPYIHEYVKQHELFDNVIIQEFIKNEEIKVLRYNEIIKNHDDKLYYFYTFSEYYTTMNNEEFIGDCFQFRKSNFNLGEIHSLIAARFLEIPLLYTNDKGASFLANKYNTQGNKVILVSGLDLMIEYKDEGIFDRDIRRAIFAKYEKAHWKERYKKAVGDIN